MSGPQRPAERWPRGRARVRTRHARARWDPDRPAEDLPALGVTIALSVLGAAILAGAWLLAPTVAGITALALLGWSVAVEVTGNTVTTRVSSPARRVLWTVLRPAYVVGFVVWAIVEALLELVLG